MKIINFWAKTTSQGKPGVSCECHMWVVGLIACHLALQHTRFLKRNGLTEHVVGALAALHDLGKISPGFQRKCFFWLCQNNFEEVDQKFRWISTMEGDHGKVSQCAIQEFLIKTGITENTAKFLATVLGAHHGSPRMLPIGKRKKPNIGEINAPESNIDWHFARMRCAETLWQQLNPNGNFIELEKDSPAYWWIAGLTSVADWIGSNDRYFSSEHGAEIGQQQVDAALTDIGFLPLKVREGLSFKDIFGNEPYDMQTRAIASIKLPGVYVIEAPMGMGKTEAALAAAYSLMLRGLANGVYFALPTQATSNRMHLRMIKGSSTFLVEFIFRQRCRQVAQHSDRSWL